MKKLVLLATTLLVSSMFAATVDGGTIYNKKCKSCHGAKAEKKALNKSQVIANWDKDKIVKALLGYKEGTYGGAMKGIMKGKVKDYDKKEMEEIAKYITTLKSK